MDKALRLYAWFLLIVTALPAAARLARPKELARILLVRYQNPQRRKRARQDTAPHPGVQFLDQEPRVHHPRPLTAGPQPFLQPRLLRGQPLTPARGALRWRRAGAFALDVSSVRRRGEDAAMNLAVWVERHARRRPDAPALADGERLHASWAEFAARAAGAAAGLRDEFGLSPGDRVAILMRNRPEYLEALIATWHAGLAAVQHAPDALAALDDAVSVFVLAHFLFSFC